MKGICGMVGLAAMAVACNDHSATLGVFQAKDAAADGSPCQTAQGSTLENLLPLSNTMAFEDLPAELSLGSFTGRKDFGSSMDALPPGWAVGSSTYAASLSEAGPPGARVNRGWFELLVMPKVNLSEGATDRRFWGGELISPATFGHGIFLARVHADSWRAVQSAFFFENDRISDAGTNLGWTGAILEFGNNGAQVINSLFHDSSLGRHDQIQVAVANANLGVVLALVSLPGRVAFYVDGKLTHEFRDANTLSTWSFHFTHWINDPAPEPFELSAAPLVYGIDFVAHYAVDACP